MSTIVTIIIMVILLKPILRSAHMLFKCHYQKIS